MKINNLLATRLNHLLLTYLHLSLQLHFSSTDWNNLSASLVHPTVHHNKYNAWNKAILLVCILKISAWIVFW